MLSPEVSHLAFFSFFVPTFSILNPVLFSSEYFKQHILNVHIFSSYNKKYIENS